MKKQIPKRGAAKQSANAATHKGLRCHCLARPGSLSISLKKLYIYAMSKKSLSVEFKRHKLLSFIEFGAAFLFTLLNISFHADISLLAFPLAAAYLAVTSLFFLKKVLLETDGTHIGVAIKLNEYLPYVLFITFIVRRAGNFGTPFVVDVFQVIFWFVIFVLAYFNSAKLYPAKNKKITEGWHVVPVEKKHAGVAKLGYELVGWVDAFFWAIFTVLIFQIFLIQLCEIPSESMVPAFLVKDKVFVSKIDCGPKFPLTDVGLPDFRKYRRGDIAVIRNPHYSMDRKSEIKTVTAQLVRMLTFTTVNINKDEFGEQKADPLVKRIVGLPGEQLVMQDGTLYRRTAGNHEFEPVNLDEKYAAWNLNEAKPKVKRRIQIFPLSEEKYQIMLDFEAFRRNYDLSASAQEAEEIAKQFKQLAFNHHVVSATKDFGKFSTPQLYEGALFDYISRKAVFKSLFLQEGGADWFEKFMTSWVLVKDEARDAYAESNFRLNVMAKITFGKIMLEYAKSFSEGIDENLWDSNEAVKSLIDDASLHFWYVQNLLDERNMPVFPANDADGNPQFIPQGCYFLMGDNRFNSLDLRHSYSQKEAALAASDPLSVTYRSIMSPQCINKKYIIGRPLLRILPLDRFGKI